MEKQLYDLYFRNRFCGTLLRLGWLIAVAAALPFLLKLITGVAFIGMLLLWLLLIAITLVTFFVFLLSEQFRSLFGIDKFNQLAAASNNVTDAYGTIMPIILAAEFAVFAVLIVMLVKRPDALNRKGRIVSASLALAFTLISSVIFYVFLR